jgi:prevent-host-death family protein
MASRVTIKELHALTGETIRRAGRTRAPIIVTDRGEPVAILANLSLLKHPRRPRMLSAEFEALMATVSPHGANSSEDLDAVRGDR